MTPVLIEGEFFSATDVARLTRRTYRQIDYWVRLGVIKTVTDPAPGSGSWRGFDRYEVQVIMVLGALADLGCRTRILRIVAARLRDRPAVLDRRMLHVAFNGDVSPVPVTGWSVWLGEFEFGVEPPT